MSWWRPEGFTSPIARIDFREGEKSLVRMSSLEGQDFYKALQDHRYLTWQELKTILTDIGIETKVRRLTYTIIWAELDGFICSGQGRGRQIT
jgi:hypothetical protein